jgi:chromosome partitioning protein
MDSGLRHAARALRSEGAPARFEIVDPGTALAARDRFTRGGWAMVVITVASRKGGSGKSTLTANLAAFAAKTRRCFLIDADPQGSLSLWHRLRQTGEPPLRKASRGIEHVVAAANEMGFQWVFIDTPPQMTNIVGDAIRAATLVVIPARPSVFDLDAVKETIAFARVRRKPYVAVINGAPAIREGQESPLCTSARQSLEELRAPVWFGQITHRTTYSLALADGQGAREFDEESQAASEIERLFSSIERSVKAIRGEYARARGMHRNAA